MKRKMIEATPPKQTEKDGWWTTVQMANGILILNVFKNQILRARHCVTPATMEYATLNEKGWSEEKIEACYGWHYDAALENAISKEDSNMVFKALDIHRNDRSFIDVLSNAETEYGRKRRNEAECRRIEQVNEMMQRIPSIPSEIRQWIDRLELQGVDFCTKDRESGKWSCSACGAEFERGAAAKAEGTGKAKDGDMVICPACQTKIRLLTRKQVNVKTHFCLIQPIDDEIAVARHFTAEIKCEQRNKKKIGLIEDIRIILFKHKQIQKMPCSYYYNQTLDGGIHDADEGFDNKCNPANKRGYAGYLYDGGIAAAFAGTVYEPWTQLFIRMSEQGLKLNYNNLMNVWNNQEIIGFTELLYRGQFYKLLAEETGKIYRASSEAYYYGQLSPSGDSMKEVFGIKDQKKINRIRKMNGGMLMVQWMRESEKTDQNISDKTLEWLDSNEILPDDIRVMEGHFSVEQTMNYLEQQKRKYPKMSIQEILSQYTDYIKMCEELHRDMDDEIVYKPQELKQCYDEAAEEILYAKILRNIKTFFPADTTEKDMGNNIFRFINWAAGRYQAD